MLFQTTLDLLVTQMNINCKIKPGVGTIAIMKNYVSQGHTFNNMQATFRTDQMIIRVEGERMGWASYDFCVVLNCHSPPPTTSHRLPPRPVMLSIDSSPDRVLAANRELRVNRENNVRSAYTFVDHP